MLCPPQKRKNVSLSTRHLRDTTLSYLKGGAEHLSKKVIFVVLVTGSIARGGGYKSRKQKVIKKWQKPDADHISVKTILKGFAALKFCGIHVPDS